MPRLYPDTRDQRVLANSDAKTLLDNWVEQRAVEEYDKLPIDFKTSNKVPITYFKNGHKCLLTLNESNPLSKKSTYLSDFIPKDPREMVSETKGERYKMIEKEQTLRVLQKMEEEDNLKNDWVDEATQFVTETQEKFFLPGFKSTLPEPKFVSFNKTFIALSTGK